MPSFKKLIKTLPVIKVEDEILQPGDIFVCRSDSLLAPMVEFIQHLRSNDHIGRFGHAGIIVNSTISFEAGWIIEEVDFFKHHNGQLVIIGRHDCMNQKTFDKNYQIIKEKYNGKRYPFYRLIFQISQAATNWLNDDSGVCSEIVADFCEKCEFWDWHKGATPDHLTDWICDPWQFSIQPVFMGWVNKNPYDKKRKRKKKK